MEWDGGGGEGTWGEGEGSEGASMEHHHVATSMAVVFLRTASIKAAVQIMPKPCKGPTNHSQRVKTNPVCEARFCTCSACKERPAERT